MNTYLLIKLVHILSSVALVGTGFGTAFYLYRANRSTSLEARVVVARNVVLADWLFTTPAVILQPATGLWLAHLAGWPLSTPWIALSIGLYLFAGLCWLPVVWLQIRMHRLAEAALDAGRPLPAQYRAMARWWEGLGYPAFAAMAGVFALMVLKPAL
ncbi:DUF2269 family protein [Denitromonas iodatirespirans]|uniref:DUF2269 domain-containing protein n=1 Tax=Denitromonas iodatirespirans TaxID=2795389 RepID=A0A944D9J2_DENI1|nr:DUF2269 domain-containing protein [Denitromonas iodatirespirans]MBT0960392.1 DUF2269 domain-containing protein [Denitromonas iodatirespirans]